jgi:uncharacterized protein (TIGR01777 family)
VESFVHSSRIDHPLENVFSWHVREGAFERLKPPWEKFEVIGRSGNIQNNGIIKLRTRFGPLSMKWVIRHAEYLPEKQFKDIQIKGFFHSFVHSHLFERFGTSCMLEDRIEYSLPGGQIGRLAVHKFVDRNLRKIFDYRHRTIIRDLCSHHVINRIRKSERPLTIAITGSSGFVGKALKPFLTTGGHTVIPLTRKKHVAPATHTKRSQVRNQFDLSPLTNNRVDAVINLAGENIFGKWTKEKKRRLSESRIGATTALCERLASLDEPPSVLVSVSAIAYYGDRGDEILSEDSQAGIKASSVPNKAPSVDFLSNLCKEWESATHIAREAGIRVVNLRLGLVLSSSGGILEKILPLFKLGLGGRIGKGDQYVSWIALEDLITIMLTVIADETYSGPVNAVSPNPVTNADFTHLLGKTLSRTTFVSVPKFILRVAVGQELRDALLLSSARALPLRLIKSGYHFRFPYLELALGDTLGKI